RRDRRPRDRHPFDPTRASRTLRALWFAQGAAAGAWAAHRGADRTSCRQRTLVNGMPRTSSNCNIRPQNSLLRGAVVAVLMACSCGFHAARSQPATAKIVGLGATPCPQFERETRERPELQREYLAWAQGFMSGVLMSRPPGVDEGLDLNPRSFGL